MSDGSMTVVAQDDRADIENALLEPTTREVLAGADPLALFRGENASAA